MKRIIEIEKREFDLIEETTFVEDTDVMFRQTAEDREKTLMMFRIIDAIKSSTPYNPTGDLISRSKLKKCAIPCQIHNGALTELCVPLYQIDNAQAVEPEKGEWARHDEWRGGEYIGGFYHVNCPCEDGYYSKWETNFCPNCGLPMKKGGAE